LERDILTLPDDILWQYEEIKHNLIDEGQKAKSFCNKCSYKPLYCRTCPMKFIIDMSMNLP